MSNVKLGVLHGSIILDEEAGLRFGSKDIVTGTVILSYKPASHLLNRNKTTADLFGPLKVSVYLMGKTKVSVRQQRSHQIPTKHDTTLFVQPFKVFEGPFKAQAGNEFRYPFNAFFPDDVRSPYPTGWRGYNAALKLNDWSGSQLPPSIAHHFSDGPDVVDLAIVYELRLSIDMAGIDIKMQLPRRDAMKALQFELPKPPLSLISDNLKSVNLGIEVQNEYLLREEERPSGLKAKTKTIFTSRHFPVFAATLKCTGYKYLHPGQQPKFKIVLQQNQDESSTSMCPETTLEAFKIALSAYTTVDTSGRLSGSSQCSDIRIVQVMTCESTLPQTFSKANNHTVTVVTSPVLEHASSFLHSTISRLYVLKISLQLKVANKTLRKSCNVPVTMVPSPSRFADLGWIPEPPAETDPSRSEFEESLPAYGEAGSSMLLETT